MNYQDMLVEHNACGTFLFVYGSLMRDHLGELHVLLAEQAEFLDYGVLRGRLYDIDGLYPGLILDTSAANYPVHGELYRMHNPIVWQSQLDEYEGCSPSHPEPQEFKREKQEIQTASRQSFSAWVYLYNLPVNGLAEISCGDYRQYCVGT